MPGCWCCSSALPQPSGILPACCWSCWAAGYGVVPVRRTPAEHYGCAACFSRRYSVRSLMPSARACSLRFSPAAGGGGVSLSRRGPGADDSASSIRASSISPLPLSRQQRVAILRSSRILPGKAWLVSRASAAGLKRQSGWLRASRASASSGMSSRRSDRGGRYSGNVDSR